MAGGQRKRVTPEDIQLVQNLIERCLQLYMNQKEAVNVLLEQARIEPAFTKLVWEKLEVENKEFFTAYNTRLIVKDQIERFNELLERQQLIQQMRPAEYASLDSSIRPRIPSHISHHTMAVQQNTAPHSLVQLQAPVEVETVSQNFSSNLHNGYVGVSSLQQYSPALDMTNHNGRLEAPSNIPCSQNSNKGIIRCVGDEMLMPEHVYSGNNPAVFTPDGNALDAGSTVGVSPLSSYNSTPNPPPLGPSTLDAADFTNSNGSYNSTSTFMSLGQIPRNFSLTDLAADFTNSNETFGSYSRSIYVGSDDELLLDPDGNGEHQDTDFLISGGNGEYQGPSSATS